MLAKLLQQVYDLPRLVVRNLRHDELNNPVQLVLPAALTLLQAFDEVVHSLRLHLHVVQSHAQIGVQPQLMRQVSQHAHEESVDGLHTEEAVVVEYERQCLAGPAAYLAVAIATIHLRLAYVHHQLLPHAPQHRVARRQRTADGVQLIDDTRLHLLRRLVGECHGEDAAIIIRAKHQQGDILHRQLVCLA